MKFNLNYNATINRPDTVREISPKLEYLEPRSYNHTSRYSSVKRIRTTQEIHLNPFMSQAFENSRAKETHETVQHVWPSTTVDDAVHVVTNITKNRLDIVSQMYYNNSQYWWIIAKSNPEIMFNPMNVPVGTCLKIPSIGSLYGPGGVLSAN